MRLESTHRRAPAVGFREALLQGLAPDGGLYLPVTFPTISARQLQAWHGLPFPSLAAELAKDWLVGEFDPAVIEQLVTNALDFPVPTTHLDNDLFILELFHGPTLAFKDFGARFLARFFGHLLAERSDDATILVATSGDTGSAVARGFAGVPGVRVVVLYPAGKVSPFQEAQMATIGGNVTAVRVPGVFDDCQQLVKRAFLDPSLSALHLSSANSINIGRLLPQSFYYVFAYLQVTTQPGNRVVFAVPSGNLGNLTAGMLAAHAGLPVERFIAATNTNDVLPEYLETGIYRARPSVATLSNAMDVGDPSNFPRVRDLCQGSLAAVRARVCGEVVTDDDTRATIRGIYRKYGYVLDPHGAVAVSAARRVQPALPQTTPIVALATAHPAKFADVIRAELGFEPALPEHERDWRTRPLLAIDLPDTTAETFRDFLRRLTI
jgi:threonine synthase